MKNINIALLAALCVAPAVSIAQGALPVDFPAASQPLSAAALKEALAGRTFDVELADGGHWRLEYKPNGYFFVNTSSGFNGTGEWRADEARLCSHLRGNPMSCNEVREAGGVLYLKRDSGEVIAFKRH